MKTKLIGFSFLAGLFLGFCCLTPAEATNAARVGKDSFALNYTTTVSTISTSAAVLYSVTLATGNAGASEFVVAYDTNTNGFTSIGSQNTSGIMKFRVLFSSNAISGPTLTFDPPLQFMNGLYVADSASTGSSIWVWEPGRGVGAQ